MIPLGNEKSFKKIISLAAFIHIILLAVLIPKLHAIGTSIAVVVTESLISFSMLLFVNGIKHRSKVLRKK